MRDDDFRRLRWRCRRGMLELDLIFSRFLDSRATSLSEQQFRALLRLLEYSDPYVMDLLMGRTSSDDSEVSAIVEFIVS